MNREALDRWCERGILGLVLAILIVGPLAFGATRAPGFSAIEGLTIGVLALWAIRLWANPHPQLLWPPICWAVLAFDPTNNLLGGNTLIRVGVARDPQQAPPIAGTWFGPRDAYLGMDVQIRVTRQRGAA